MFIEHKPKMKFLQVLFASAFLAKTALSYCENVFILNKFNLTVTRCMEVGQRDTPASDGFLLRLQDCDKHENKQKFTIVIIGEDRFMIIYEKGSKDNIFYLKEEGGELTVPGRLRAYESCKNCIEDFTFIDEHICPDGYDDDYCLTAQGNKQLAGKNIIVFPNGASGGERFNWTFTNDPEDLEESLDIFDECME
mmetsp:Transcript_3150/g.4597  ORF Transcript_3150/g.4597 Transcript_3150/m.4597 type:complete len:194 (+) Transcript_3150:1236-1817(+)